MLAFREVTYIDIIPRNIEAILVGDIGGTNSNFGIFQLHKGMPTFLFSMHFKSQGITNFVDVVIDVLTYIKETYNITIKHSCFAAAGVVSQNKDFCKPTNLDFALDAKKILQKTDLVCAFIVNDFEVIGYGLSKINPEDLIQVHEGMQRIHANKAILGAGTGLGKSILLWDHHQEFYVPVTSEGGHADFPAQNQQELDLINFIIKDEKRIYAISWEDILSGYGIQRAYRFFRSQNHSIHVNEKLGDKGPHPDEIFKSRNLDEHAWNTFILYTKFYARCAKNFALDALALGGVYIAGGIAAKNLEIFKQEAFINEFINCGKQQELLKNVPIFVIADYNVSLYGAVQYMLLEQMCPLM